MRDISSEIRRVAISWFLLGLVVGLIAGGVLT